MTTSTMRPVGYLDALRKIVPTEQIEPESMDPSVQAGSWAVEPATQEELIDLMRWANAQGAIVYTRRPRRQDAETCGGRPRIYLRGRRMQRVKDIDIVSGTCTVQAGITMHRLHAVLHERGFTTGLPTRPWRNEPLGAVLAAALDAHWGPKFGAMEEHVVALGVVLPDGTAAHSRCVPRKAVGPDFDRLFLGSRGRYGIIYQATMRVYPAASRVVLSYGAPTLKAALDAIEAAFATGLDPRAIEVLTPTLDRAWGRKRAGLTDALPVMVLVEPRGPASGRPLAAVRELFADRLETLEPPVGWALHEGLLPPARDWVEPVVGVSWAELLELAADLGDEAPTGMWLVRLSRQGGWLSLASKVKGAAATTVRALIKSHHHPRPGPWDSLARVVKDRLDPRGVLNPYV